MTFEAHTFFKSTLKRYTWIFILLFIGLLPFGSIFNIPVVLLAVSGLIYLYLNKNIIFKNKNIKIFCLVFLSIWVPMVISLTDAVNIAESLRKVLSFLVFFLMGITIVLNLSDADQQRKLVNGIGILLTIWCLDAIWQSFTGNNILGFPYSNYRLTGIFYPNYRLGLALAILSPFYFEFIRINLEKHAWLIILLIPYGFVIVLSGNKNSWMMLLLSLFLYSLYLYKSINIKNITRTHIIIIFLVFIFSAGLVSNKELFIPKQKANWIINRIDSFASLLSGDIENAGKSFHQRTMIWEAAIRVADDHWINGVGPRGFRYIVDDYINDYPDMFISSKARGSTHPHLLFLEVMTETGLIGLIGYILFCYLLLNRIMDINKSDYMRSMLWAFPAIIAVFPFNTHKSFYGNYSAAIIWVLVALSFASIIVDHKQAQELN